VGLGTLGTAADGAVIARAHTQRAPSMRQKGLPAMRKVLLFLAMALSALFAATATATAIRWYSRRYSRPGARPRW